jgi:membrane protease YdiL (CAAX protease family)
MSTMTTAVQPTTGSSFARLLRRSPLLTFFVLAFALTWPLEIVDALGSHGVLPFRVSIPLQLLGVAYMPTVAALIVTALTSGRAGVRALLRTLLIWRVSIRWYAIAIFGFALVCFSTIILYNLVSGAPPLPLLAQGMASASGFIIVPVLFLLTAVINGEELAWRGFALPRLQARWNALTSSTILGVIWAVWHLPLFYTLGMSQADMSLIGYTIQLISASVIFTWLYNHTRGSVLLAYLMHAALNTWTRVFPIDHAPPLVSWYMTGVICLIAVIIVFVFGAEHLSRTRRRVSQPGGLHAPATAPVQA